MSDRLPIGAYMRIQDPTSPYHRRLAIVEGYGRLKGGYLAVLLRVVPEDEAGSVWYATGAPPEEGPKCNDP